MSKLKKEKTTQNIKGRMASTGNDLKKSAGLVKETGKELSNMTKGLFKLPWKDLPLQGYLYIGIVALVCIAAFVFVLISL